MRAATKAAIVCGAAVAGWLAGMIAGGIAWSLLRFEYVEGGSGNSRDQYLWPFVGSTAGALAGAAVALAVLSRRRPPVHGPDGGLSGTRARMPAG
jgi:hypothetical protein